MIIKKIIILFVIFTVTAVNSQTSYLNVLAKIKRDKINLRRNNIEIDSVKRYLLNQYENNLFPYWIGTPWDYNGYSNTPKKSSIACGYFVSTTLKHLGFNWNRYDLAKMYSQKIVENTCDTVFKFHTKNELNTYIRYKPDNLYIVGLTSHVGLVLKYKGQIWFIHSDYYDSRGPVKEKMEDANALNDYDVFWCGTFFTKTNINKWLMQTKYNF